MHASLLRHPCVWYACLESAANTQIILNSAAASRPFNKKHATEKAAHDKAAEEEVAALLQQLAILPARHSASEPQVSI